MMNPLFAKLDLKTSCRALADLLMPRLCIVCGRPLNLREEHICLGCEMDFPYTRFWESTHNAMADEFNSRIVVPDGVRERYCYAAALFFYNSQSGYRNIARELKYNFRIAQGRVFARRLGEALAGAEHFADVDAVVPVPLHWTRRWKRGYNQAEIIAREVAAALGAPLRTDILSKPRRRTSKVRSNAQARGANISGAFKANVPEGIRHILLVDDTFTTGSTLAACHAALRECVPGDVRISAATLAFVRNR